MRDGRVTSDQMMSLDTLVNTLTTELHQARTTHRWVKGSVQVEKQPLGRDVMSYLMSMQQGLGTAYCRWYKHESTDGITVNYLKTASLEQKKVCYFNVELGHGDVDSGYHVITVQCVHVLCTTSDIGIPMPKYFLWVPVYVKSFKPWEPKWPP